jgi:hypothetical protein
MLKQWLDRRIGMAGVDVGESAGSLHGRKVYAVLWETLTTRYKMGGQRARVTVPEVARLDAFQSDLAMPPSDAGALDG